MLADNMQQQQEELSSLKAIFENDCSIWIPERRCEVLGSNYPVSSCIDGSVSCIC